MDSWPTAERIDLQAGVVSQSDKPARVRGCPSLDERIFSERVTRLRR